MSTLKNIGISTPCQQSWSEMSILNDGRHCDSCTKIVTDFTTMNSDEIIAYLSVNKNVCGRFSTHQLVSLNHEIYNESPYRRKYLKTWALVISFLGSIVSLKANAQVKQSVQQTAVTSKNASEHSSALDKITISSEHPIEITGRVTDSLNEPLQYSSVSIKGQNIHIVTNTNGEFKLVVPLPISTIMVCAIGYQCIEISINANDKKDYNVKLKEQPMLMGEVIISRH